LRTINEQLITSILLQDEAWKKLEKTETVLDNFAVCFSVFCAEKYDYLGKNIWREREKQLEKTTKQLLIIFKNLK
jgi:hypothetical protein